eukprot:CAMPEP_0204491518 /NCGR_PEP_ID=MMETSP0471-20130131/77401_1 /ASSEMBLY_ACC=CAM_ASM_000602 /TAXON_ID=2969 /ORGANISM="Oxyrrhis marina" /LENGTH=35 /DNA_ID= /DNA_START= /DNA_END= /DNA_ORIENTATION=
MHQIASEGPRSPAGGAHGDWHAAAHGTDGARAAGV